MLAYGLFVQTLWQNGEAILDTPMQEKLSFRDVVLDCQILEHITGGFQFFGLCAVLTWVYTPSGKWPQIAVSDRRGSIAAHEVDQIRLL